MKKKGIVEVKKTLPAEVIDNSPAGMIRAAVAGGSNLEQLKGLLELQKDYEANEAKKAYHKAMAAFKMVAPETILKDKKVNYTTKDGRTVKYSHARLATITKAITTKLSEHGLSVSWSPRQEGDNITITCKITHILGHSESFSLAAKADDSGGKNPIQALGSAVSYLERYTLLAAIGLATEDQDDDGMTSAPAIKKECIDQKQVNVLLDAMIDANIPEKRLLEFMKIDRLENMLKVNFNKAMDAIAEKKNGVKK